MKESGLRIRIEESLRQEFLTACKAQDLSASHVLRTFMRQYVDQQLAEQQQPESTQLELPNLERQYLQAILSRVAITSSAISKR